MSSGRRGYLFVNALKDFITSYNSIPPTEDEYMNCEDDRFIEEMDEETINEGIEDPPPVEGNDDEAYKEFIRITRLHQRQLQEKKVGKNNDNELTEVDFNAPVFKLYGEEYFWADKVGVEGVKIISSELPNEQAKKEARKKEKEKFYGNKALDVMAYEANMTLNFKETYNTLNPPLYPCVSLRIGK
uniref:Pre-mRNA-splicing factor SLU7 n=1 Tax=Strongyloides stercoralis TaxID=6248 RepID=A0A0K0E199_STRER